MSDWSKHSGSIAASQPDCETLIQQLSLRQGYYLALTTQEVVCGRYENGAFTQPDFADWEHLLELRVFNEDAEFYARRDALGKPLGYRYIRDNTVDAVSMYDEWHYLDLQDSDTIKPVHADGITTFTTTGGGVYKLPVAEDIRKVHVRSYIEYSPETGTAMIVDWRAVGFAKEGGGKYGGLATA